MNPDRLSQHFGPETEREMLITALQTRASTAYDELTVQLGLALDITVDQTPDEGVDRASVPNFRVVVFGTAEGVGTEGTDPLTPSGKAEAVSVAVVMRELSGGIDSEPTGSWLIEEIRQDLFQIDPQADTDAEDRIELDDSFRVFSFERDELDKLLVDPNLLSDRAQRELLESLTEHVDNLEEVLETIRMFPEPLMVEDVETDSSQLFDFAIDEQLGGMAIIGSASPAE